MSGSQRRPARGPKRRQFAQGVLTAAVAGIVGEAPVSTASAKPQTMPQTMPTQAVRLESLTWAEAEAVLRQHRLAVVPVGARCKEHGMHLPLNTDFLMAEYLAERIAQDCPVVLLPTVQYGYYPAFVEYPGSMHIRQDAFRDTLEDICHSLARHGLRRVYFLNTGISTSWALEPARQHLAAAGILMEYTDLTSATAAVEAGLRQQSAGTHADEIETSMLLYMAPQVVQLQRAQRDIHPERGPGPLTRDPAARKGVYSPTGAWGDPTLATKEKGRIVTEALVAHIKDALRAFAAEHYVPAPPRERYLKP